MSFVAELKQRKVFRVATVYLVVAWVAVQAASIALPAFDAPPWVLRVVILLIALGFPFALVLAWALEVTPRGVRFSTGGSGTKRIGVIAAVLVVLALLWFFRGAPALHPGEKTATAARGPSVADAPSAAPVASAAADARSVAVLPFVNMSGDPANEYFSDGIAETTLDMLAQVPDLKVVARTSSFAFKGKADDVRKIGAALGAATLLEGSVQRAGDAVRITAQLVKATDGTHLWSKHFDRRLADVFKIQDEVATEVVRALRGALPAEDQQRLTQKRTENVEAYQEYLKGVALMPGRKVDAMREAMHHFERATQIDPAFAQAYVALADAIQLIHEYAGSPEDERPLIASYIDRALTLAPDLGEAHASRAVLSRDYGDVDGAEREFQRAIELAPSYASGFQWYGELLGWELHDPARAVQMMQRAVTLDPLSPIVQDQLVNPLIALNRFDDAHRELAKLLREHPDFAQGYVTASVLGVAQGDLVTALRAMREQVRLDPAALERQRAGCFAITRFGAIEQGLHCLDELALRSPDMAKAVHADRAGLMVGREGPVAAWAELQRAPAPDKAFQAYLLLCLNRDEEALALLRSKFPQQFDDPPPTLYVGHVPENMLVATAMLRTGSTKPGRARLQQVVDVLAAHPVNRAFLDMAWWDVFAFALLGDNDKAIATLSEGIAGGTFLDVDVLDKDPLFKPLRTDPRYEKTVAPARARAAAQVAAAQKEGLL